ncbi:E3 ubiquitin ligase BIG BROTHER-related-like isoform X2 [Phragmites australis]|uniref:E3 ubiquitin ligase BIG BROTHER-related-like isoform X2 n=1 Tax=Phragmites australis TaxID=29695 RepID=UPI002D793E00|nr:E3 ubiquitin ligase BIG BROTHER-related-like isoform X2 [Phragmites australis]
MATVGQPGAMRRITVHYSNSPTRNTGDANLEGLDDDHLPFVLGDVLQDQEDLYQSILEEAHRNQNHMRGAPSDQAQHYHGESSTGAVATASRTSGMDEQIASDFAYAKQLQEMEDLTIEGDDDDHDHNEEEADRQDGNDDPDNMTYEQRQELVESVGIEGRGLSDDLISYLQSWKYKSSGFFSRKTNHEDCPICLNTFKHRESLITLPCKHNYHAVCVTKWLKIDKTCPICKYEVFGPS